jgi:hypothetical protein
MSAKPTSHLTTESYAVSAGVVVVLLVLSDWRN